MLKISLTIQNGHLSFPRKSFHVYMYSYEPPFTLVLFHIHKEADMPILIHSKLATFFIIIVDSLRITMNRITQRFCLFDLVHLFLFSSCTSKYFTCKHLFYPFFNLQVSKPRMYLIFNNFLARGGFYMLYDRNI